MLDPEELRYTVRECYDAGHSFREIGELANCSASTVLRFLRNPTVVSLSTANALQMACETLMQVRNGSE